MMRAVGAVCCDALGCSGLLLRREACFGYCWPGTERNSATAAEAQHENKGLPTTRWSEHSSARSRPKAPNLVRRPESGLGVMAMSRWYSVLRGRRRHDLYITTSKSLGTCTRKCAAVLPSIVRALPAPAAHRTAARKRSEFLVALEIVP